MDFYVINRFAQDGSLLAREPAPDLPTARKTAFDMADPQTIPFWREAIALTNDGDTATLPDGTTVRLDVL